MQYNVYSNTFPSFPLRGWQSSSRFHVSADLCEVPERLISANPGLKFCSTFCIYSGTPPYDHLVNTTTPLLRPLFCGPNKSPLIFLSENPVNPTTPLLRPTTTFGSPESLFSLQNYPVNTTSQNAWWGC